MSHRTVRKMAVTRAKTPIMIAPPPLAVPKMIVASFMTLLSLLDV
jgi:hypothetical protein